MPPTITDRAPQPGDGRFVTLTARRPVLEQAFARCAQATPGLDVRRGVHVTGLATRQDNQAPRVTGVRLESGERLGADLVVDAMGRRSPLPRWLEQAGARPTPEETEDSGYTYYSRFFGSPGGRVPDARAPLLTALGSFSLLTLPADNDTWSVTVYVSSADQPLKRLRDPERWTRLVAACPLHAHWLDGEPITGIVPMAGVADRRRRLAAAGQPLATGVALLADSWACTNPSQGRGISLGLRHAQLLRDVARTHLDDPHQFAAAWDKVTETELTPWYDDTVAADRARVREMDAARNGTAPPAPDPPLAAFLSAMAHDPDLLRAFCECVAGLTTLTDILARPGLADRAGQLAGAVGPIRRPAGHSCCGSSANEAMTMRNPKIAAPASPLAPPARARRGGYCCDSSRRRGMLTTGSQSATAPSKTAARMKRRWTCPIPTAPYCASSGNAKTRKPCASPA
ncbi:MAG: FAD-dependent oxidoreductase [Streptosporangiaceae bacterium]|nr:FAD-dependent oxidoreductase [Streptosporangiaceae bacterium]